MNTIDVKFSAAFRGGEIRTRELRLTQAEADYIRAHYPVRMRDMGESWYEITIKSEKANM